MRSRMLIFGADSDPDAIRRAIDAGERFWLDMPADRFDVDHPAARALGIDARRLSFLTARARTGRPGSYVEDDQAMIVFAGAVLEDDDVRRVDVIVLASAAMLVTLYSAPSTLFQELREAVEGDRRHADALAVLDALTDSLLDVGEQLDGQVDDLESRIVRRRSGDLLVRITGLRQKVSDLLAIARSQRGLVLRAEDELAGVAVAFGQPRRRVRDLSGHLARAVDLAESTRQAVAEALNLYLSIAAENLTRVATVLLPLTVISGFFGMNFGWMVDRIDTFWTFLVLGIGGMVAAVAGVRLYLARKGYL